jgi:SRSO17 transposase
MKEKDIGELAPAWREHLRRFRAFLGGKAVQGHINLYCRGLQSDLPRKSVEPIALSAGATVRSLQLLLTQHDWDEAGLRNAMQRQIAAEHLPVPGGRGGGPVMGWIDETSAVKKGEKTPGVQRQYCGAAGKIDNCIVTVHLAVGCGDFSCLIDSDLYVPRGWIEDKPRCLAAGIPRGPGVDDQAADRPGAGEAGAGQRPAF